jgi:hypothetical protein
LANKPSLHHGHCIVTKQKAEQEFLNVRGEKKTARSRTNFWLLLLCAVLGTVMIALLLPAVCGAASRSREAEVSAEISQLGQALSAFKNEHGVFPPDTITIPENGLDWQPADRANVRRMWPQFRFEGQSDLNHDGDTDDVHVLNGAECLVFFLGGVRVENGKLTGFWKNPVSPFTDDGANRTVRTGPYFDFDTERFTDVNNDGFCEYGDTYSSRSSALNPAPYLYLVQQHGRFRSKGLAVYPDNDSRNLQKPYDVRFRSPEYQIISPGFDGEYGVGGEYGEGKTDFTGDRKVEADNITSFSPGTLSGETFATRSNNPIVLLLVIFSPIALFLFFYLSNGLFSIRRTISDSN